MKRLASLKCCLACGCVSVDKVIYPEFRLTTDINNRATVIENMANFCGNLPVDKVYSIEIREEKELRRKVQGDLLWVFHGIYSRFIHETPDHAHALFKYHILLPIKLSANSRRVREQAAFEKKVLSYVPDYETRVKASYEVINSRSQPLNLFANAITVYQGKAAEKGCLLESNNQPEYDYAVYGKAA